MCSKSQKRERDSFLLWYQCKTSETRVCSLPPNHALLYRAPLACMLDKWLGLALGDIPTSHTDRVHRRTLVQIVSSGACPINKYFLIFTSSGSQSWPFSCIYCCPIIANNSTYAGMLCMESCFSSTIDLERKSTPRFSLPVLWKTLKSNFYSNSIHRISRPWMITLLIS